MAPAKKKANDDHCIGRSRGGLSTKIHALVDARGLPIDIVLTPGQRHDVVGAAAWLGNLGEGDSVLGDKAYDTDGVREQIQAQGAVPNIPDKASRTEKHCFSKTLYKERNLVERFFNKIKHFRRIATRFEKLAQNFRAMINLASIRIWLRHVAP